MLHGLRPAARALVRARWNLTLHGVENFPSSGPVIVASNHVGWLDGPLLAIVSPRPVHALSKAEMFDGSLGVFLRGAGQIRLDRFGADPAAIKACLRVLGDGGCVGIFPEGTRGSGEYADFHHGVTYLAAVSGAPVLPVTQIGTRLPGGGSSSLPPAKSPIDVVYGRAWRTSRSPWPRTREQILTQSQLLWDHLRAEQADALALTGRSLPGPLPVGETELDPDTGFHDHLAGRNDRPSDSEGVS